MFITPFAIAVFLATAEVPWVAVHNWLSEVFFCVAPVNCGQLGFLANTVDGGGKIEEKTPAEDGCESLLPKSSAVNEEEVDDRGGDGGGGGGDDGEEVD